MSAQRGDRRSARLNARVVALLTAFVLAATACTNGDGRTTVIGPGAVPAGTVPDVRVERTLDLSEVDPAGRPPPREVTLEPGSWESVAGWLHRETSEGRPVLVNFFASYCEPCVRELPLLLGAAAAEPDVTFLGIHSAEQVAHGERMIEEFGIDLPTFTDPAGDIIAAVDGRVLPYTVVFDVRGHMVGRVFGELTEASLEALLTEARRRSTPPT